MPGIFVSSNSKKEDSHICILFLFGMEIKKLDDSVYWHLFFFVWVSFSTYSYFFFSLFSFSLIERGPFFFGWFSSVYCVHGLVHIHSHVSFSTYLRLLCAQPCRSLQNHAYDHYSNAYKRKFQSIHRKGSGRKAERPNTYKNQHDRSPQTRW